MSALLIGLEFTDSFDNWPQNPVAVFGTVEQAKAYLEASKLDTYVKEADYTVDCDTQFRYGSLLSGFEDAFVRDLGKLPNNPEFVEKPRPEKSGGPFTGSEMAQKMGNLLYIMSHDPKKVLPKEIIEAVQEGKDD